MDWIHKNFTPEQGLYQIDVEVLDLFTLKRKPIQFQWERCIDKIYALLVKKHPHLHP